ncbi:glycosyltransferase family 2 protein [Microbacterium indicum]|uniref:glycosyltransferase family 2 protein n=1 Tax=Microbacterium indicum TaxID=358100 RepID=UPI0003FD094F|nr:glycosyltransferase family 2 protein [Microbacterium indicum]
MTSPKLSVVIPAFRQADYIEEAMRSVLDQRDVDLELVVADHSSGDGTYEAAERLAGDPRVRLLTTPTGGGAPANWAAVTAAATGEHIKLLPGDDAVAPGSLARQAALLDAHPGSVLTAGRRRIVDERGRAMGPARGLQGLDAFMTGGAAAKAAVRSGTNPFGEPGAVMMRRAALEAAGGWQGRWSYAIDVASYLGVLRHGSFVRDDAVASTFRVSAGQWSVALADEQSAEMRRLFDWAAQTFDEVDTYDVARGARRARTMAGLRRAVYAVMPRGKKK